MLPRQAKLIAAVAAVRTSRASLSLRVQAGWDGADVQGRDSGGRAPSPADFCSGEIPPWQQMAHAVKASSKKAAVSAKPTRMVTSRLAALNSHSSSLPTRE